MTVKEHIFIITVWILLFIVYFTIFSAEINIHENLIISFVSMAVLKSLYDIKNRTGSQKTYVYSEQTNQKLRYLAFTVVTIVATVYHYLFFCNTLKYCV